MSSLHDNNALNGHNRSVLSPNGGTVDFGSALSKSVFQQHKQNSKQQQHNINQQQPINGGDFNQSLNPLTHYQDPAILGGTVGGQPPPTTSTQNQQMDNHQTVPTGMENSTISLLQDPPLTVSDVEADAVRHKGEASQISASKGTVASKKAFNALRLIVTVGWAIYPIGYYLGYTGSADANTLNIVYNLADFVNKIAFGVVIWAAATSGSKTK
jgi:hypothetical protein